MFNFSELKEVKKNIHGKESEREKQFYEIYNKVVDYLILFDSKRKNDILLLQKSAKLLESAIKIKKNHPESYLCLAYIFYIMGKTTTSIKYYKIGLSFAPDSKKIRDFGEIFNTTNNIVNTSENNNIANNNEIKNEITEKEILEEEKLSQNNNINKKVVIPSIRRVTRLGK
ncbi:MAG: hypothetical protein AABZ74_17025 [Cyanobacteriota bacterium]